MRDKRDDEKLAEAARLLGADDAVHHSETQQPLSTTQARRLLGESIPLSYLERRDLRFALSQRAGYLARFYTRAGRDWLVSTLETELRSADRVPAEIADAIEHRIRHDRRQHEDAPHLASRGDAEQAYRRMAAEFRARRAAGGGGC